MEQIELVVKVPKDYYESLKALNETDDIFEPTQIAIARGTPLPKGHGRLIDADAVLEDPIGDTYKDINIAETIIEADKEQDDEDSD